MNKMALFFIVQVILVGPVHFAIAARYACGPNDSADQCLLCNCYHEARGEKFDGKVGVTKVVLSRLEAKNYGNSICGVVYKKYQFQWTAMKDRTMVVKPRDQKSFEDCKEAVEVSKKEGANGVLYFMNPETAATGWAKKLKKCGVIGRHHFYVKSGGICPEKLGTNGKPSKNRAQRVAIPPNYSSPRPIAKPSVKPIAIPIVKPISNEENRLPRKPARQPGKGTN